MLAQYGNRNINHDIRVQRNGDSVIANDLERALRHADLCFLNREALLGQRFSDIEVGDGTEQTAIDT